VGHVLVTFQEFCEKWNVTGHERRKLRWFLIALRIEETLKATL
jgi:hypothetical protein